MTALIGFTNDNMVVLAADNRITHSQTKSQTDDYKKLFGVHGALALAIGGKVSLSTMVLDYLNEKSDVNKLDVESAATLISEFLRDPGALAC
jgi:20S proteasome alpha/beta subunit